MWSAALFGISLVGLVALFACKSLELSRGARTPLESLRRFLDPIITEGWAFCSVRTRSIARKGIRICLISLRTGIQKTEATFDATIHVIATRLNRYLRTRRLHRHHGGEVSTHLKTVLEKTEKGTAEPDSL